MVHAAYKSIIRLRKNNMKLYTNINVSRVAIKKVPYYSKIV